MAGTNTEQPANKAEQKKVTQVATTVKENPVKAPVRTEKKVEEKTTEQPVKKEVKTQAKTKREEVKVSGRDVTSSTKVAVAICKFIKNKELAKAIEDLEQVTLLKKAVPMKGEIPHRKGKMMSGRFPERAAREFIMLVKSLQSNANNHDIEEPVIVEAIANIAQRPFAKGGRARKKRSHITLVARDKKTIKKVKNKK